MVNAQQRWYLEDCACSRGDVHFRGVPMEQQDLIHLTERISRLEAFNRRLSRAVVLLLVVLASAVWMGQRQTSKTTKKPPAPPPVPKVIEAQQFLLKEPSGRVLAEMGVADGGPMLRLVDAKGADRATLGLGNTGSPRFVLKRSDGSQAVSVSVTGEGVPVVELAATDATKLRLAAGGEASGFDVIDPSGALRAAVDLRADGPTVTLAGADRVPRAVLNTNEYGPSFTLFDEAGRGRLMLSARPNLAAFGLLDSANRVLVGLEVRADKPALGLYSASGKALFVKP
jgi:hypothetical protein